MSSDSKATSRRSRSRSPKARVEARVERERSRSRHDRTPSPDGWESEDDSHSRATVSNKSVQSASSVDVKSLMAGSGSSGGLSGSTDTPLDSTKISLDRKLQPSLDADAKMVKVFFAN